MLKMSTEMNSVKAESLQIENRETKVSSEAKALKDGCKKLEDRIIEYENKLRSMRAENIEQHNRISQMIQQAHKFGYQVPISNIATNITDQQS